MMASRIMRYSLVALIVFGVGAAVTRGAIVAEYDAAAQAGRPGEVAPAWTVQGNRSEADGSDDMGDYLSMHLADDADAYNSGDYLRWLSPATHPMVNGSGQYGIEVKMKPVDDYISTGYGYEAQNIQVSWSDDVYSYSVSFDQDSDDAGSGTTGRMVRNKYGWTTIVDGIDWSVPHTIGIIYDGAADSFYFFLDDVYQVKVSSSALAVDATYAPYVDLVVFGDGTTGGYAPDYDADWYFVRLHDTAFLTLPVEEPGLAAEYDASKVTNQRPDEISPAWGVTGNGANPTFINDVGDYLAMRFDDNDGSQSTNNGDSGTWASPATQTVTMLNGTGEYGIEVKLQPLGDFKSAGHSYEYANIKVTWSDDVNYYLISFDKDNDDDGAGTVGKVSRGKYPMLPVINGVDWSVPHTVAIIYEGASDLFHFWLDGVYAAVVTSDDLRIGGSYAPEMGRVTFGDSTSGGFHPDYDADWYFVRLYSSAFGGLEIPEPDPDAPIAEYDAAKVTGLRPDQLVPAWDGRGVALDPTVASDEGDYLLFDTAANDGEQSPNLGDYGDWGSPLAQAVDMTLGVSTYSVEVKVRPLTDFVSTGHSYEYANIQVAWADDVNTYRLSFDLDSDDFGAGMVGRVTRGKYPMVTVIGDVDWSVPHTVGVSYHGPDDAFYVYFDGAYVMSISSETLASGATYSGYRNRVTFGDSTGGGAHPDYSAEWYFVRLYEGAPLGPLGVCGDAGHPYPAGDVNRDCGVNLLDVSSLAQNWLLDTRP